MEFWSRVNERIKQRKTTQEAVAKSIGRSLNTIRGLVSKEIFPRVDMAVELANELETTVEFLTTGKDSIDPWLAENRQLIDDLKALTADRLSDQRETIHTLAEKSRRELGKVSSSG